MPILKSSQMFSVWFQHLGLILVSTYSLWPPHDQMKPLINYGDSIIIIKTALFIIYITHAHWGKSISARNNHNGHLFFQEPDNRPTAKWALIKNTATRYYQLQDQGTLVHLYRNDNRVHHGSLDKTLFDRFLWKLLVINEDDHAKKFCLMDKVYGKIIVARGGNDDIFFKKYTTDSEGR